MGSLSWNYIELILNCERTAFLTALLAGIKSRNQKAIIHSDLITENYILDGGSLQHQFTLKNN